MKCDVCGREIQHGEETEAIYEVWQGKMRHAQRETESKPYVMCPECVSRRGGLGRFVFIAICLTIGALAVIGYLLKW